MPIMDYLIGMLWARGSLKVIDSPYISIEIGIRDISRWQIDVLEALKEGEFTSGELADYPTISPHNLVPIAIETFLVSKTKLKTPVVDKNETGKWRIINATRFADFLKEKKRDKENFLRCREQISELERQLNREFRDISQSVGCLDFNIRTSSFRIQIDPYLMEKLVSDYNLPRGPDDSEMYWRMPSIPLKISKGSNEEKTDFIRGVADVCGTLEGNTPRGRDARIKFDIKNNVTNEDRYKATVRKSVNLCNFFQENLGIPIAGNYISLRSNPRPHKLKIWIGDLTEKFEMPLWNMKIHYQQRLNLAISRTTMPKSKFCCSIDDNSTNSIKGLQRWLRGQRKKEPSLVYCIRYCSKLQSTINQLSLDKNLEQITLQITKKFKEARGEDIP
ncbi:MAG: hypothetical protein ACFFDI_33245 [Promethearchaeota archaeon]